jgi:hypothetical protein
MKFSDLTQIARDLASSDPSDQTAFRNCLESVSELRELLSRHELPEVAGCLDAACQVIEALAGSPAFVGRPAVKRIACRMLYAVGLELGDFTLPDPARVVADAPSAKPAPPMTSSRAEPKETAAPASKNPRKADMRFGRMLVELGHVTRKQVAAALRFHRNKGPRIGECLLLQGAMSPEQLLTTLEIQDLLRATPEGISPETLARYRDAGAAEARDVETDDSSTAGTSPIAARHVTQEILLGEVLLGAQMITNEQLEEALHQYHHTGVRVDRALVQMGVLTEEDVQSGLALLKRLRRIATTNVP